MSTSVHTHNRNRILALQELDELMDYCTSAVTRDGVSIPGRKTFGVTDPGVVVAKLARAFALDCSVKEACFYAGISRYSFYRFCAKHPGFRNTLENIRMSPIMSAKVAWIDAFVVHGNWKAAFEYLKVHRPEEFDISRKVEAPMNISGVNITVHE